MNERPQQPLATRLLMTGASGYLGSGLASAAASRAVDLVFLGSEPVHVRGSSFPWRLGEIPPRAAFSGVSAVIHAAHSRTADRLCGDSDDNVNLEGSFLLARAALEAGVRRFVFVSSTSAGSQAPNAYGRIKYKIEARLAALPDAPGHIGCVRVGLVFGGAEQGLFGRLARLVRRTPVLPMIGTSRLVQPIFIDDVCRGLLALATGEVALRPLFGLAAPDAMAFGNFLRLLRRALVAKNLYLLPIPLRLALSISDLTRIVPFAPRLARERILGSAGTPPIACAADLAALGIDPTPIEVGIRSASPPAAN